MSCVGVLGLRSVVADSHMRQQLVSMPPTVTVLGHPEILDNDLDVDVSVPSERPSSSSDKEAGECLAQTKSSSSSDEEAAQAESIAEFAADIISKLEPVRPDAVRATRVQNVLHRLGRPLRLGASGV